MTTDWILPENFSASAYQDQIQQQLRASETILFDGVFCPDHEYFVACSNTGRICVWNLTKFMIYTLSFVGEADNRLLISGGDESIRVWRWTDILAVTSAGAEHSEQIFLEPLHEVFHPQKCGIRGAKLPFNETNSIAVNREKNHIFTATGDGNAYEWDISTMKCVKSFQGHKDYIHEVEFLGKTNQLITASEDGTVGIWDARTSHNIDFLRLPSDIEKVGKKSNVSNGYWVGSLAMDESEAWVACGGGRIRNPGTALGKGYLSLFHLPSRTCTMSVSTPMDVQDLSFRDSEIVAVGNHSSIQYWNRGSGKCTVALPCSIPSSFFVTLDDTSEILAVGGSSPVVDICSINGVHSFSLQFA